jgi:hypothetical protein
MAIEFINGSVTLYAYVVFGYAVASNKSGFSVVAFSGINLK